jgi:uncharacterized BrkB/YihY/UPF0761 family membrane protein
MLWAFLSGLILLAGAHFSAHRYLRAESLARDKLASEATATPRDLTTA